MALVSRECIQPRSNEPWFQNAATQNRVGSVRSALFCRGWFPCIHQPGNFSSWQVLDSPEYLRILRIS